MCIDIVLRIYVDVAGRNKIYIHLKVSMMPFFYYVILNQ